VTEPLDYPTTLPVVVGVSGHRNIHPESLDAIRRKVAEVLERLQSEFQDSLYVMTGLADGADQLVHHEAKQLGIGRIAALPMAYGRYVKDIKNRASFDAYWQEEGLIRIELPSPESAGQDDTRHYRDRHYEQLGAFLISRSHLLLVLWEGPERQTAANRGQPKGGTADVLDMRFDVNRAIEAYGDSHLFAGCDSRLDVAHADPVLQIVTPREDSQEGAFSTHAGECYVLHDASGNNKARIVKTDNFMGALGKKANQAFAQIRELNSCVKALKTDQKNLFNEHVGYLKTPSLRVDCNQHLAFLKSLQAETDVAAATYQRRLIGLLSGVPLGEVADRFEKASKNGMPLPWPGALTVFGLIVPLSVLSLELRFHLHLHIAFLAIYLILVFGTFGFFKRVMQKNFWQDRFQDYRALAEALRVQLYWAVAAMPIAASDNYLRKQAGELGWIQFALRGPAIWATALALELKTPRREDVRLGWVENQIEFFSGTEEKPGKAKQNEDAANRNKAIALGCFGTGMAVILVLFFASPLFRVGCNVLPSRSQPVSLFG